MRLNFRDRRSEERFEVEEELLLSFDDPAPQEIRAVLTDYSKTGFRARHDYSNLQTGQVVRFQRLVGGGEAKVIWNRISDGQLETGFLVLFQPGTAKSS